MGKRKASADETDLEAHTLAAQSLAAHTLAAEAERGDADQPDNASKRRRTSSTGDAGGREWPEIEGFPKKMRKKTGWRDYYEATRIALERQLAGTRKLAKVSKLTDKLAKVVALEAEYRAWISGGRQRAASETEPDLAAGADDISESDVIDSAFEVPGLLRGSRTPASYYRMALRTLRSRRQGYESGSGQPSQATVAKIEATDKLIQEILSRVKSKAKAEGAARALPAAQDQDQDRTASSAPSESVTGPKTASGDAIGVPSSAKEASPVHGAAEPGPGRRAPPSPNPELERLVAAVLNDTDARALSSSEDEGDEGESEDGPAKDPTKQPVFEYNSIYDDFASEEQTSVIGQGIRSLLRDRKSAGLLSSSASAEKSGAGMDADGNPQPAAVDDFIKVSKFSARQSEPGPGSAPDADSANPDDTLDPSRSVPWLASLDSPLKIVRSNSVLTLHNEIVQFSRFIQETPEEKKSREADVETIRAVATELWPDARVEVFGSFANDLCIPSSDVDMVLLDAPENAIHKLSRELSKRKMVREMEVIASARIPIIKLKLRDSLYSVDISFGIEGGIETGRMIRKLVAAMPTLRPLILVVKFFLWQRDLNETYRGGIGSHLCLCLVVSMLQQFRKRLVRAKLRPADRVEDLEDLGSLLLEFLDLYGRRFNYANCAISLREGGKYTERSVFGKSPIRGRGGRPALLAVENPESPDQDLGASSYNMPRIRKAFAHAHRMLMDRLSRLGSRTGEPVNSVLEAIINVTDAELLSRHKNEPASSSREKS